MVCFARGLIYGIDRYDRDGRENREDRENKDNRVNRGDRVDEARVSQPHYPYLPYFPYKFHLNQRTISRQKCQDLPTSRNCTGRGCTQCTSPFRAMSLGVKIGAYHEKYFLLEGIRYNARRISRRWAVLEVLPIDEIIR